VIAAGVVVAVAAIAACLGPSLSTTEQQAIVVQNGSSVNLGNIMIGATGSGSVTITPAAGSQSSSDTIQMITKGSCPGWGLLVAGLPATVSRTCTGSGTEETAVEGATACTDMIYSFDVSYTPTAAGSSSCTITISGVSFGSVNVVALANGLAQAFAMDVQPKEINFGDVRVGNTGSQSLTVRNTGSSPLTLGGISINPTTSYSVNQIGSAIPPNVTMATSVSCTPATAGAFDSTLTVDGGSAGQQTVSLHCNGINSNLNVTPSPGDLTTRVAEPRTIDVTIQNLGAPSLLNTITIVPTVTGVPMTITQAPPNGTTLGSGSSAIVKVRYAPTAKQATTELAKLRINHDNNQIRDIVINGGAMETTLAVFPDSVDFGGVCAGTTEMKDVDVKGGTEGDFTLMSVIAPSSPFALTPKAGTTLPGIVMGNQGNKLEFVASITAAGGNMTMNGEATLNTDIPGAAAHKLMMTAEILPPGVGATPSAMDFGGVMKNAASTARSTTIRNCSADAITIDRVALEGANGLEFAIVLPAEAERLVTLQPRESITYSVIVNPTTPGAKIGALVVVSGATTTKVDLFATALGGGDSDLAGVRSYYTCGDCNSGGGAGIFAFVIFLGLRRRRR
jgi:hypothetical protein